MAIEYLGLSEINGPLVVLEGVKNAIVHLYNSTSVAQREQVFRKSESDSHTHTTVHLSFSKCRVDQCAGIMYIDDIKQFYLTHRDINFDFCECTSEGVGI